MSRSRDRISSRVIAIVLSFAIACYGCIFSTPEAAVAAGLSLEEPALREAGGESPGLPNDEDALAFMVVDVQLTGEDSISLSWSDLGTNFVYTVEYCDSLAEGSWSPCPPVEQWPTGATSWTDTSVTGSGTRFYRIHTEALSAPPLAPTDVTAVASEGQLVIRWSLVPGASSYNVYWSTDAEFSKLDANLIEDVRSPFTHVGLALGSAYHYMITAVGNKGESEVSRVVSAVLAPAVDRTVVTSLAVASEFLYTGENPVQTGVEGGTIEPDRVAVLRGKVTARDGESLPQVTISVLNHPEFGQTETRGDGMFDMVVNGGDRLIVNYSKDGYLRVQRQVEPPQKDYAWLPDVVMIPRDSQVTTVDLEAGTMQVARGSVMSDADGTRQATLLCPQETAAELEFADGSRQSISTLSVRATEYTVGDSGPRAMPAELPRAVGYTYCVDFTVDEAESVGAKSVRFDSPLPVYVENFLEFPVGGAVPVGYYDADRGVWVPSDNGRIVEILSVEGGVAELDVDGSGQPADGAALAALGITDAEREQLSSLYPPGQSLWRFPVTHFSPWDCNWPYGPPEDAEPPQTDDSTMDFLNDLLCKNMGLCKLLGSSEIDVQNQVLGESVSIAGTPFRLHYESDRVRGREAAYSVAIPLSGDEVSASLKRIELDIAVAGRRFRETLAAEASQSYSFTWDGKDAYGRTCQGQQQVTIGIGYVYDALYQEPAQLQRSFGELSGVPISGSPARQELTLGQTLKETIGAWDAQAQGLGGWTLSEQHAFDPAEAILHRGDGTNRKVAVAGATIDTVAGGGDAGNTGEGFPAREAYIVPGSVAFGSDGSLYFTEYYFNRVRKVTPEGTVSTVAGNMLHGYSGDGVPATQTRLARPTQVVIGPDESVYIGDHQNLRVRRVDPDGIIHTFAGNGLFGDGGTGDGGPASEASFKGISGMVLGPDGSLYISDYSDRRVRRIGPDGIINTVVGGGSSVDEGVPAIEARLYGPGYLAMGADGSLYLGDETQIRRVSPDGIIRTVAGDRFAGELGDGGPATEARLKPGGIVVAPDGSFYLSDRTNQRVRRVDAGGIITTISGTGVAGYGGDGGPAARATINSPQGMAVSRDGNLYFVDSGNNRIRSLSQPLLRFGYDEVRVPSEDGTEVYIFDTAGRHLRTVNSLTGATTYELTYEDSGLLTAIEDGDGNITTIERDADGSPTAIIAPFGQRTSLSTDVSGYLETVVDPADSLFRFRYENGGLLRTLTNPRGHVTTFTYDDQGRLIRDENAVGGLVELERTEDESSYTVTLTTAEEKESSYKVELLPTGESRRVNTLSCCSQSEVLFGIDGSKAVTHADGTVMAAVEGPDPRFGMLSPMMEGLVTVTPGNRTYQLSRERVTTLSDPNDPLSLETLTDTETVNGRSSTGVYDAVSRTWFKTSAEGRQVVTSLDEQARPVAMQTPGLETVSLSYDGRGRLETLSKGARQSEFEYDESTGYMRSCVSPLGERTTFSRDLAGRVTGMALPDGSVWGYEYDEIGNLEVLTQPDGTTQHHFTYTATNLVETYRSPLGAREAFAYDKDKRLVRREFPSGQRIDLVYSTNGQLTTIETPQGDNAFDYDADSGLLIKEISRDGQEVAYTYDGGLLTEAAWSSLVTGNVAYAFSDDLRVSEMSYAGLSLPITYDDDGLLTGVANITLARDQDNGSLTGIADGDFQVAYGYNSYGEVSSATATHGSDLYDVSYTHDALGRISQKVETVGGATHTWDYEYDSVGRLITVKRDDVEAESYSYDNVGNRIGITNTLTGRNLTSEDYNYDADNKLLTAGETSYSYDADGRLHQVTEGTSVTTYSYNTDGTLLSVDLADGRRIAYQHDARGRRVARTVDGVRTHAWLYGETLMPLVEYDGSGELRTTFIYSGLATPVSMIRDGASYHVVIDHLGSPRLVVDASGNLVKRVDYDSFGNVISDSNPAFDLPFGFASGMSDPEHELLRFGARDYQPSTGRWTAKDPILFAGGGNLYGYVGNDPVNFVDRDGEIALVAVLFIVLVIVVGMFLYPDPLDIPSQGEDVKRMEFIFGTVTCGKLLKWAAGALIGAGGKIAQWGSKITNWVRKGKTPAPTTTGTPPGPYSSMTALEMEAFMDTFQSSSGLHAGLERLNVLASALKARGYSDKKITEMLGKLMPGSFKGF